MGNFWLFAALIVCAGLLLVILAAYFDKLKLSFKNMKPLPIVIIGIVLMAATVFLCFRLFGQKGEGSIFSENMEAESAGPDDFDEESLLNECLSEATAGNVEGDLKVYIRVRGDKVSVGAKEFKELTELKDFLGILVNTDSGYVLVDDYASAKAYEGTMEVLESVGIKYTELTE